MVDLANVMAQGQRNTANQGAELTQQAGQLTQQTGNVINNQAKLAAMETQKQARVDEIGGAYVAAATELQKEVSRAKGLMDKAETAGGQKDAQAAYNAAMSKQKNFMMSIARNPSAIGTLNAMTMADEDLQNLMFNQSTISYMTPEEQEEFNARFTMYAMLEEQAEAAKAEAALERERQYQGNVADDTLQRALSEEGQSLLDKNIARQEGSALRMEDAALQRRLSPDYAMAADNEVQDKINLAEALRQGEADFALSEKGQELRRQQNEDRLAEIAAQVTARNAAEVVSGQTPETFAAAGSTYQQVMNSFLTAKSTPAEKALIGDMSSLNTDMKNMYKADPQKASIEKAHFDKVMRTLISSQGNISELQDYMKANYDAAIKAGHFDVDSPFGRMYKAVQYELGKRKDKLGAGPETEFRKRLATMYPTPMVSAEGN